MIYSLSGTLKHIDLSFVVIECGGVGFKCTMSSNSIRALGEEGSNVSIFTYLAVREDAMELYGFCNETEQDAYLKLITVSGIGPKAAMSILSTLTVSELANAVVTGNERAITASPGVGPKAAQRIILELKSKFDAQSVATGKSFTNKANSAESRNVAEAVIALEALGYVHGEAVKACKDIDPSLQVNTIIKLALKNLM